MQKEIKQQHLKIMHQLHFKINGVQIDNAEDLDVAMSMYNLLEYSKNHKKNRQSVELLQR